MEYGLCGRYVPGWAAFRTLTVVDNLSRHSQVIEVEFTLTGTKVVEALERVAKRSGYPMMITVDNGSAFTSKALDAWADAHGVKLDFIQPGKPVVNAVIESFNGRFRDECFNANVFVSLDDARQKIEAWRIVDNEHRRMAHSETARPKSLSSRRPKLGCRRHRISRLALSSVQGGGSAECHALLNGPVIWKTVKEFLEQHIDHSSRLWAVLMYGLWRRYYVVRS